MRERQRKGGIAISQSVMHGGQPILRSLYLIDPFHVGVHGGDFFMSRVRARHVFFMSRYEEGGGSRFVCGSFVPVCFQWRKDYG